MKDTLFDHQLGSERARVTLVEYGDYQCPYSAKFDEVIHRLLKNFPQNFAYIYRHFPMVNIHENAGLAAMAAEAAGLQGKFWEMHHQLFQHQNTLKGSEIIKLAKKLGLDVQQFQKNLESEDLWQRVQHHIQSGIKQQVTATPSLYLNNEAYEGSSAYGSLKKVIENLIFDASSKFI